MTTSRCCRRRCFCCCCCCRFVSVVVASSPQQRSHSSCSSRRSDTGTSSSPSIAMRIVITTFCPPFSSLNVGVDASMPRPTVENHIVFVSSATLPFRRALEKKGCRASLSYYYGTLERTFWAGAGGVSLFWREEVSFFLYWATLLFISLC